MSDAVKGNEAIRADTEAFMAAFDRAREAFLRLDGVVGVGFGHKEVAGAFTFDVSIQVFVEEKRPDDAVAPAQRIPPTFEGYRTDVRTVPASAPMGCNNVASYATIRGGLTIEPWRKQGTPNRHYLGTLGCLVRKRGDPSRENWHILTCEHVLFVDGSAVDDPVYHPMAPVGGAAANVGRRIATIREAGVREKIKGRVPLSPTNGIPHPTDPIWEDDFWVDCGTAQLMIDSTCCESICGPGVVYDTSIIDRQSGPPTPVDSPPQAETDLGNRIAGVRSIARDVSICLPETSSVITAQPSFPKVFKVGHRTGRTAGYVRSVMSPTRAEREIGMSFYPNVIEIEYAATPTTMTNDCGKMAFADHGDSGAIVLDANDNAIGVLFRKEPRPGADPEHDDPDLPDPRPGWRVYACHILPVLDALRICIPTTGVGPFGKTYGTTWATDGSGLDPRGTPAAGELPRPGARVRAQGGTTAPALPDAPGSRARMDGYRTALRDAPGGRALHDAIVAHRDEVVHLVRHVRPVTVAWHRNKGPAHLALAIGHLRGETPAIPLEVGGVPRDTLLARMGEVLTAHGSPALRATLAAHGPALRAMLAGAATIDDAIAALRVLGTPTSASSPMPVEPVG